MEQVEATEERIAEVVQNNSAAAQETSATSEELTAQATTLSGMVSVSYTHLTLPTIYSV